MTAKDNENACDHREDSLVHQQTRRPDGDHDQDEAEGQSTVPVSQLRGRTSTILQAHG